MRAFLAILFALNAVVFAISIAIDGMGAVVAGLASVALYLGARDRDFLPLITAPAWLAGRLYGHAYVLGKRIAGVF